MVKTSEYWKNDFVKLWISDPENRKLGVIGRELRKQFVAKMKKKLQLQ